MTDEEKLKAQQDILKAQQRELLKKLKAIGSDIWGGSPEDGPTDPDNPSQNPDSVEEKGRKQSLPESTEKKTDVTGRPKVGMTNLWMTADETVDWTDALAHDRPADGLTPPKLWQFYHEQAEKVLTGDVQAYAEVLRRTNPLGDLTGFADGLTMRAPNADQLEGQFTCREELLEQYGQTYPAAMGLRIARDLMACLPVSKVNITAYNEGKQVMNVTYSREALRHVSFQFTDPVKMTLQCGGKLDLD